MSDTDEIPEVEGLAVRTYFVRNRNALIARADFTDLYVDYYLHLAQYQMRPEPAMDTMLKDAVAAVTLHSASKPWNEIAAWTIHFEDPLLNLFVTGNNPASTVTGNLFEQDVKCAGKNLFYSDLVQGSDQPRRSVVDFEGKDVFAAVEVFCRQSEQRPTRYFHLEDDDFVMITAQPDCDLEWFESLDVEKMKRIDQEETLRLLETRHYRWECGCNQERIMEVLAATMRMDPDALFDGGEMIRVGCPRCGAKHKITRESLEAYVATHKKREAI